MAGHLRANYVQMISPALVGKVTTEVSPDEERSAIQGEVEYDGEDFSAKVTASNTGAFTSSLLQSVGECGSLGLQVVYQPRQQIAGGVFVARYNHKNFVAVASLSSFGILSASYLQKVSDRISLATTIEYALTNGMSEVVTG